MSGRGIPPRPAQGLLAAPLTCKLEGCNNDHEGLYFRTMITKILDDEQFIIDHTRCDVCGDFYTICPSNAVEIVIDDPKN